MMKRVPSEFEVYRKLIDFLIANGWTIICASPPGGTDNRYPKCLLPRREIRGSEKGPRDEVDSTAFKQDTVLLVECKPRLSNSLTQLNALSESDYQKLKRIAESFSPNELSSLLGRTTELILPESPNIALALAVGLVDRERPTDITVFEFETETPRIWGPGLLKFS